MTTSNAQAEARAAFAQATQSRLRGEAADAMGYAQRAVAMARESGEQSLELDARLFVAELLSAVDDTEGTIQELEQARALSLRAGEDARAFKLFSVLSSSLVAVGDMERSFAAQHQAMEIADRLGDPRLQAIGKSNFASRHIDQGERCRQDGDEAGARRAFERAAAICQPLLSEAQAMGDVRIECAAGANLGAALVELGRPLDALPVLAASGALAIKAGLPTSLVNSALYRARGLRMLGQLQAAHDAAVAGLSAGGDDVSPLSVADLHKFLCELDEERGHWPQALGHHRRFHELTMTCATRTATQRSRMLAVQLQTERALLEAANSRAHAAELERANAALTSRTRVLSVQAEQDPLTGLANRRRLAEFLQTAHAEAQSRAVSLCVALLDVDHFKLINDRYSHAAGDAVLRQLSKLIQTQCRDHDLAARYGGEEFVIVLSGLGLARAAAIAERLRERIEADDWSVVAPGLRVTASFGICDLAAWPDPDAGLAHADALLYRAKESGRNRVVVDGKT